MFLLVSGCAALAIALAAADVQADGGHVVASPAVAPLGGTGYTALTPARLLDTRPQTATVDGLEAGGGAVGPGQTVTATVLGRGGVPATGVGAVALHVTAVGQTVRGYVTVYPTGIDLPGTSNLNPIPDTVTSNLVIVPVGVDGKVSLFNSDGSTNLIVDVEGWYPVGSAFHGVTPTRVVDTRPTSTKLGAHETLPVQIAGVAGVPTSGVSAAVLNLTSVGATASTFLTVHASGSPMPATSNLNVQPAIAGANLVVVPVGADGKVSIVNDAGSVHVVVDILGWYAAGPGFNPVTPARVADTRSGAPLGPHATRVFQITGNGGVPLAGAGSVVFNLTAARQTERSFLTVFPTGASQPLSSDLNPQPNVVAPNLVIAKLGPDGTVSIYNESGTVDVIIDVVGWQPSFVETSPDAITVTEDDPATLVPVLANDIDHDGHPLQIASVTQPATGTAAIVGGGMAVTYAPPADFCNSISATNAAALSFGYTLYGGMSDTVTVHVTCVDDAPVAVDDSATVTEDDPATAVAVLSNDTDIDAGPRSITGVTQPANGTVAITGGGSGLTYLPNANYCNSLAGGDTFTYTLNGGDTATVSVMVTCVDDAPTAVQDAATITEDDAATAIPVLTNDTDIDAGPKTITAVSTPANGTVVITGGGSGLNYAPNADYCNSPLGAPDTFTYTLNGGSAATVSVTVLCANDAPSFTSGANQTALEDAGAKSAPGWATALSAGPANESTQTLAFTVTNNTNAALFSVAPAVAPDGTLTFTPAANANGVATITLTLTDSGGTANGGVDTSATQQFTITVTAVNDAPSFTKGADQLLLEDASVQSVPGWATGISAGPANESGQVVSFSVTGNSNAALFSTVPAVSPSGVLTFTPAADANGSANITVRVADDGGTANGGVDTSATQSFTITVTPVNDAPSFVAGASPVVLEDSGAATLALWPGSVSVGPADEAGQTRTFSVTNNTNVALFSVTPAVSPTGTLTFTPAPDANGTATITLTMTDSGGTADGGVDTSLPHQFSIVVSPVNDAPSFTKGADQTVLEDAGAQSLDTWATAISRGPVDEAGQTLTFAVTDNTNAALFTSGPAIASDGTLTFTPAANANGSALITLALSDSGGTANGGADTSATQTFTITVTAVNDAPSFTKGANQSVNEDAAEQIEGDWATAISKGPADEAGQSLTFAVVDNTNPTLFSSGPIVTPGGTLRYTPASNANGTATITIALSDNGGTANGGHDTSATQSFVITVVAVNDAPGFVLPAPPDQAVVEDSAEQTVAGFATNISAGPTNESGQSLTFHVSTNDNSLFSGLSGRPTIDVVTGDLVYTPAAGVTGTATVSVFLTDNGGTTNGGVDTSPTATFDIVIFPPNATPIAGSQTGGSAVGTLEDTPTTITLTATDADQDPLTFAIVAQPSHGIPGNLGPVSCFAGLCHAQLTYTPDADYFGPDSLQFRVNDGTIDSLAGTVEIVVTAVNDAPSFTKGTNQSVAEDSGPTTVSAWATGISAGPANESGQSVSFAVTANTNTSLFLSGPVVSPTGTLTFTPALNANGIATITLAVTDDGGTANSGVDTSATQQFTINVTAVNDAPSFTKGSDRTVLEDAVAQSVTNWATAISSGPANESVQTVTFAVTGNTNPGLFSAGPAVAPDGTLTFTPAANANGSADITLALSDSGGTANGGVNTSPAQTFTITVTAVNDAPSFTKSADPTVLEDAAAQSLTSWATGISKGAANESGQTLTFNITGNDNPGLFSAGPAVGSDGTLTFTPAGEVNGTANITLTLSDNGGTANGGADTSASQSFTITVTPVNDFPIFGAGPDQSVAEDATPQTVTNWVASVLVGPANEVGQTVSYSVTNNTNTALFASLPTVAPNGTLNYTPAANQFGSATITLVAVDSGGTANGGVNTSAPQTFTITVTAVNDAPVSAGRAYGAGSIETNMQSSFVAGSGLLVGATDPNDVAGNAAYTPVLTVGTVNGIAPVAGTITTTVVGVGTIVADATTGAFTLDPAAGVTGAVSFTFTVCDSGEGTPSSQCTGSLTATFDIAGPVVWFVDPTAATTGTGTLTSPFKTLAEADLKDGVNHRVFVYSGTTATGLALNSGEFLVGQAATGSFDTVLGVTPPSTTIARPTLGGSAVTIGGTVTLATNSRVQGVSISSGTASGLVGSGALTGVSVSQSSVTTTTGTAVDLNNARGTYALSSVTTNGAANGILVDNLGASAVTISGGAIVGATSRGVDVNLGNANFTYGGTISTTSAGRSVEVTNHTGGTVTFSGTVNDSGLGVNLASNTLSTFSFSSLTASTGANTAFNATGGGTIVLTGVANTLTTSTGTALNLDAVDGTFTFASVTTNGAANGILANNLDTGVVAVSGGSIVGATARGVDLNGGSADFTYAGSITTTSAGRSVEVTSHTGGTVLFSGSVSDSGQGVNLASNTNGIISFTGGVTASTGTNPAFTATGGGTVSVTGSANTLTTTTGTALNVANTTIGGSGLTFRSISAGTGASGPVNGIVLNTTGSLGGLTVVGTGSAGTGGTIQHTGGAGISLASTQNASFARMIIDTTAGSGISGTGVTNFSFTNGTVSNSGDGALEANIAFNNGTGFGDNIDGTLTVTGSTLSNGFSAGLDVQSDAGTVTNAVISNNTVSGPGAGTAGISILGTGNGTTVFHLTKATINQNNVSSAGSAGIQVSVGNANAGGPGANAGVLNDATNIVAITNNAVTLDATGTNAIVVSNGGANPSQRAQTNVLVQCNGKSSGGCTAPGTLNGSAEGGTVVLIGNNGFADMSGTVNNNVIDANHTPLSAGGNGIGGGNGIAGAGNAWTPSLTLTVTNNVITDTDGNGILLVGRGTTGVAKYKIQNNVVAAPINAGGTARYGIRVDAGSTASADDAVCLNISGNTSAGSNGAVGIGLRKQGTVATTNDFGINGMSATASPNVEAYVTGLNAAGGGTELISATSGFSNCSLP